MKNRIDVLTGCSLKTCTLAMTLCATATAWADSAQGVDTVLGNGILPTGQDPTVEPGGAAVGTFRPGGSHSPTGLRNQAPRASPTAQVGRSGWNYSLSVEAGYWGGDGNDSNYLSHQYRDEHNGPAINWFGLSAEQPGDARFLNLYGSAVGRTDAFFGPRFRQVQRIQGEGFRRSDSARARQRQHLLPGRGHLLPVVAALVDACSEFPRRDRRCRQGRHAI